VALMLVGEQPGDAEDRAGLPFVGPAGRILDEALLAAGLERRKLYVTNAVKHFKWEARGKRRLHKRPTAAEVTACRFWLAREIEAVRPRLIVALGATAVRSLLERELPVAAARGKVYRHASGVEVAITYHPSAVLRADANAAKIRAALVQDLRRAGARAGAPG
jgi:DNA polymerase